MIMVVCLLNSLSDLSSKLFSTASIPASVRP
nr:MAG TPA: hypothetical protein [Caudoviricetes sp.]